MTSQHATLTDATRPLRWAAYGLLIAIATGGMLSRIAAVTNGSRSEPTPLLSANDRSRWSTIRALVDEGTYAIDNIIFDERGNRQQGWHTIDLVRHRASDGREHFYSSKPTLLPTLLAGEYWLVRQVTGVTLEKQTFYVVRVMLVLTNVLPLVIALILLARIVELYGSTDAGRLFVMAGACSGTFVTTFACTLNNHTIAAVSAVFTLVAFLPVWCQERREWRYFLIAGLTAAFTAANELPALAFFAAVALGLFMKAPLQTLVGFLPPALLVAAAAFGTNYYAHGDWKTPYAHRKDGPVIAAVPLPSRINSTTKPAILEPRMREQFKQQGIELSTRTSIVATKRGTRWVIFDPDQQQRYAIVSPAKLSNTDQSSATSPPAMNGELRQWDNWYEFDGSYWSSGRLSSVDNGEPSIAVYAVHCLIGHHGIFSLTPIWILSLGGCAIWMRGANKSLAGLAWMTVALTVTVLAFYFTRGQIDRNYSGFSCCLRWMIWFTPLWLLMLIPAADWLARYRWGWSLAVLFLVMSVFSAQYAADNPWTHPWIFDYWTHLGWIEY